MATFGVSKMVARIAVVVAVVVATAGTVVTPDSAQRAGVTPDSSWSAGGGLGK